MWLSVLKLLFVWNSPVLLLLSMPLFPSCWCGEGHLCTRHILLPWLISVVCYTFVLSDSLGLFSHFIWLFWSEPEFNSFLLAPVLLGSKMYMNTNVHLHHQRECSFHTSQTNWTLTSKRLFKWAVDPEMKILLSSAHPHHVTNSYKGVKSLCCFFF